jgi:hypothetical protein
MPPTIREQLAKTMRDLERKPAARVAFGAARLAAAGVAASVADGARRAAAVARAASRAERDGRSPPGWPAVDAWANDVASGAPRAPPPVVKVRTRPGALRECRRRASLSLRGADG